MARYYDIEKIKKFDVKLDYSDIFKQYGELTTSKLKNNPAHLKKHRRRKEYSSTWQCKTEKIGDVLTTTVYNAKNGPLTYLLENGHLIVNKKGGVGWAAPKPHISTVFDEVKNGFIRAVETRTKIDIEIS